MPSTLEAGDNGPAAPSTFTHTARNAFVTAQATTMLVTACCCIAGAVVAGVALRREAVRAPRTPRTPANGCENSPSA
ncbi:hypothetical protein AB0I53_02560 [Saccharopolyspora sp. NPDC050389]|uniref:hypothetical protein n=1 Tax=Saccharopolyspora sp. NPDC050389 TaxID=3155516 RepID=UPI0033C819C1